MSAAGGFSWPSRAGESAPIGLLIVASVLIGGSVCRIAPA
jgi:hypothetical protein